MPELSLDLRGALDGSIRFASGAGATLASLGEAAEGGVRGRKSRGGGMRGAIDLFEMCVLAYDEAVTVIWRYCCGRLIGCRY